MVDLILMKMEITEVEMDGYDSQGCLHEIFRRQARKTPDNWAVHDNIIFKWTFGYLDYLSDCLAVKLGQCGVGVNTVVGILMVRPWHYVVSVLGILKAGAAYLPLEVSYPQHLLDSVLEDATPLVVCTTTNFVDRFHKMEKSRVINMKTLDYGQYLKWNDYRNKMTPASVPVSLDDMACIVYSSGTTGKPKGTRFTHRDALFSHTWRHRAYPYKQDDRVAVLGLSAWDMLGPLIEGIGIFLITDNVIHDSKRLVDHLQYHGITRVLFTPSLLQAVLELQGVDFKEKLKSVRQIWLHGEVVTTKLRDKLCHLLPWIQLLNLYRISECPDVAIAEASAEIDTDLSGKIVLVSEASSDIGAAIAEKLALCNAKVAMFAANFEQLENLKKKLQQAGACHVLAMKVDVTSSSEVKNAVEIIENCWGPVEILVDNGNCMYYQVMKNCDVAKWCKMEDVNGKGSLNCLAAVVGGMAERKSGRIVNITSDAGKVVMEKFDFSSSVETLNPSDVANAVVSALKQPFSCSILK